MKNLTYSIQFKMIVVNADFFAVLEYVVAPFVINKDVH